MRAIPSDGRAELFCGALLFPRIIGRGRRRAVRRLTRLRTRILARLFPLYFRRGRKLPLVRVGTRYGGWWIPTEALTDQSICYAAGVGTDVSFEDGLLSRFGCRIWSIDPTPDAIAYFRTLPARAELLLVPVGLAGRTGPRRFYVPAVAGHISHSIANLQRTSDYFEAECRTVVQLMRELRHDHLALLKLDIEGAEHEVVESMLEADVIPDVVCLEFDQPEPVRRSRRTLKRLRLRGYDIVKVEGFNVTLVHTSALR